MATKTPGVGVDIYQTMLPNYKERAGECLNRKDK
jgi:hypothetical protein